MASADDVTTRRGCAILNVESAGARSQEQEEEVLRPKFSSRKRRFFKNSKHSYFEKLHFRRFTWKSCLGCCLHTAYQD
ncbi:hypothetical protein F2P79_002150 [Pimephales promelas]|nr:hypothetical protein F2P79_002150 [Pimephales promelas]